MMNTKKTITPTELEILNLLWDSNEPMTSSEIVNNSPEKSWKPSYIHLAVNSLLKKGYIEIAGFKPSTKNYARSFRPIIGKETLIIESLFNDLKPDAGTIVDVADAIIQKSDDRETVEKIRGLCEEKLSSMN